MTLKEKRIKVNMTQEELAINSGVSRQTISQIENAQENNEEMNIKSLTMLRLAKALKCDVSDIFFKENVVFTQHN